MAFSNISTQLCTLLLDMTCLLGRALRVMWAVIPSGAPAAADGPEKVAVVLLVASDEAPVGSYDVHGQHLVSGQPGDADNRRVTAAGGIATRVADALQIDMGSDFGLKSRRTRPTLGRRETGGAVSSRNLTPRSPPTIVTPCLFAALYIAVTLTPAPSA